VTPPLEYTVHPIVQWPGKPTDAWSRKRAPFKANWTKTLALLERELRHLGAENVKFRLDVRESDLRNDGQLRANARPRSPAVLIEFVATRLPGRPVLLYRCDTFGFWQDNIDAIARGLEALRLVDRYGVTPTGEQYAGFKALPASTAPTLTTAEAAGILEAYSEFPAARIHADAAAARDAARVAVFRTHPDRNSGQRSAFDRVEVAKRVLSSHHGVSI